MCVAAGAAKSIGLGAAVKHAEQGAKAAPIDIDPVVEKSAADLKAKGYDAKGYILNIADVVDFVFFLTVSGEYCTGREYNITGGREMH